MSPLIVPSPPLLPFSERVRHHPRIVEDWPNEDAPQVLAINDQLLFARDDAGHPDQSKVIRSWLETALHVTVHPNVVTVFGDGLPDDVEIWKITNIAHLPASQNVFSITDQIRLSQLAGQETRISPNHVLVPAPNGGNCPDGPPHPAPLPLPPVPPKIVPQNLPVAVIDAGYQWQQGWGANPLNDPATGMSNVTVVTAEVCNQNPQTWNSPGGPWVKYAPEVLDSDHPANPQRLDALAGHANFVAGVIARRCRQADITIWDHNGGFAYNSATDPPLEAAVCRSIWMSQQTGRPEAPDNIPSPVIHVGSSFAPHAGFLSNIWTQVLWRIAPNENSANVIVAPSGNQGDQQTGTYASTPRYPAALHVTFPERVIGVASLDNSRHHNPSKFANTGPWVACSAIGEGVRSTFLPVDLPPEENPAQVNHNFEGTAVSARAWAAWNGTSFSSPKVSAAIADALPVPNPDPGQLAAAIQSVMLAGPNKLPDPNLGFVLTNLG